LRKKLIYFIIGIVSIVGIILVIILFNDFKLDDKATLISTAVSIIAATIITILIFQYQEKGQQQNQLALIDIDLVSKRMLDKEYIYKREFLYATSYGFNELLFDTEDTKKSCANIKQMDDFIDKSFVDLSVRHIALKALSKIKKDYNNMIVVGNVLYDYNKEIDNYLNKQIEKFDKQSLKNAIEDEKWIIVVGTKYENGKIVDAKVDKKTAIDIKKNLNKKKIFKSKIKRDIDLYFSEDKEKNLIIVGG